MAVLVISRVFKGLPALEGEMTILDIDAGDLVHRAFAVDDATDLGIVAYGSLEDEGSELSPEALAAYPWIIRRKDRSLVWRMDPSRGEVVKGTLVRVDDTVRVGPGEYDLYFASFGVKHVAHKGNPLLRLAGHWSADRKNWQVALRASDGVALHELESTVDSVPPAFEDAVVWSSGPVRGHETREQLFAVQSETPLLVYSIGEFCNGTPCDIGWIDDLKTGSRVWQLSEDNTVLAGGSKNNRLFNGIVTLEPGTYRAVYKTDAGHAFNGWYGNPPLDPLGWGITLATAESENRDAIDLFDLWTERDAFVSLTRVRDDEHRTAAFLVSSETPIVAFGMGEMTSGSKYDYGWIEDDRGNTIWEMSYGATSRAGGSSYNRVEQAFLVLKPGRYVAHYVTDGSHSYDDWNKSKPDNPERWGLTLFAVSSDNSDVSVEAAGATPASPAPAVVDDASRLVDLTRVGNDASLTRTFTLASDGVIRIRALGEITASDRYDYGWIEDSDGNVVWEMTKQNTSPDGGGERLRRYEGTSRLEAGEYVVHFKSDFSYAFGDFDGENPARPYDYGIQIFLESQTEASSTATAVSSSASDA